MTESFGGTFERANDALEYIFAGHATITIRSMKSGDHYTFNVNVAPSRDVYFVSLLTDGETYTYIGILRRKTDPSMTMTTKSKMTADSTPIKAFNYMMSHLQAGNIAPHLEIMHEGTCGRCGRALTNPNSIERGIGPECARKVLRCA